jgi:small subunit ribosomal protein S16
MPVKIRLQRHGRKKAPFYHIVIADARSPRDGKYIEKIGTYNPMTKPATIDIDRLKAYDWLTKGAQPTDTVLAILRFKGVLFRKHLMRGVAKGAMTQEEADQKWQEWIDAKETKISSRKVQTAEEKRAFQKMVSGAPKAKPAPVVEAPVVEEAPVAEAVVEEAPAVEEAPVTEAVVEEAPAVEAVVEEAPVAEAVVEEAPVAEAVVEEAPAAEAVVEEAPAVEAVVEEAPAVEEAAVAEEVADESTDKPAETVEAPTEE